MALSHAILQGINGGIGTSSKLCSSPNELHEKSQTYFAQRLLECATIMDLIGCRSLHYLYIRL
jgi:hypothetical protein